MRSHRTGIILGMTALAIAVRVLPYVFARFGLISVNDFSMSLLSVAPIGAMCLFGGARHSNRWIGVGIPAAAWFASESDCVRRHGPGPLRGLQADYYGEVCPEADY